MDIILKLVFLSLNDIFRAKIFDLITVCENYYKINLLIFVLIDFIFRFIYQFNFCCIGLIIIRKNVCEFIIVVDH